MKIVVLTKEVPDTGEKRTLSLETGILEREKTEHIIDEISERAVEVALRHRDSGNEVEIVVLCMAPGTPDANMRKLLAMGADRAIIVQDPSLVGADAMTTAGILAAAVEEIGADLVIAGDASTDGRGGVVPAMVGELLGWAVLPALDTLEFDQTQVGGSTRNDYEILNLSASLPAVVSITERSADARFPNFRGIRQAKKKSVETLSAASLGTVSTGTARSVMVSAVQRPERTAGVLIHDDGSASQKLVEFLTDQKLV